MVRDEIMDVEDTLNSLLANLESETGLAITDIIVNRLGANEESPGIPKVKLCFMCPGSLDD